MYYIIKKTRGTVVPTWYRGTDVVPWYRPYYEIIFSETNMIIAIMEDRINLICVIILSVN